MTTTVDCSESTNLQAQAPVSLRQAGRQEGLMADVISSVSRVWGFAWRGSNDTVMMSGRRQRDVQIRCLSPIAQPTRVSLAEHLFPLPLS